jgi:citrate lyase beta subunit
VGKFVEAAFEPAADEREQAFEILEALREAGGFDEGTAVVTAMEACSFIWGWRKRS